MASIRKKNGSWVAEIRKKGHKSISKSFPNKGLAKEWATKTEADMNADKFVDKRSLSTNTVEQLINEYTTKFSKIKPFGKNKKAVLEALKREFNTLKVSELTEERLMQFVNDRLDSGAGGVTISIDLSYLATVYRAAKQLFKMPVDLDIFTAVRQNMALIGISTDSDERDRRPTEEELKGLCDHFANNKRQRIPMHEIIMFAVATTMRASEITSIRWADLNEKDQTIIIRDRKHPKAKLGNDQVVPLRDDAFKIVMGRKEKAEGDRIFPYKEDTFSSIFPRACATLKIKDLRFHDLRHEGISRLFEAGYRIEQVAVFSGHRDWKQLKRYTQLRAKNLLTP